MKLSEFKYHLGHTENLSFLLPDGTAVPSHFHVTEAGLLTKHFIDCGKTIHLKKTAVFQLWTADDTHHRLEPETVVQIIDKSHRVFDGEDPEVEIEYQMETIGKFGLEFENGKFLLTPTYTDCLAKERCEVPPQQIMAEKSASAECCTPAGGCC
jgi:hypothetical protein